MFYTSLIKSAGPYMWNATDIYKRTGEPIMKLTKVWVLSIYLQYNQKNGHVNGLVYIFTLQWAVHFSDLRCCINTMHI